MHYIPESAREFLQADSLSATSADSADSSPVGFHYRSAPIYLLTAVVGLLLAADLLIGSVASTDLDPWSGYQVIFGFRLALLAAVIGGSRILFQSLEGLLSGRIGADLALTIACLAAILLGEPVTAALVVFVALCGESIEGYTVDQAQRAIRGIFQLCPRIAHRLVDSVETDVAIEDLQAGDLVVVRPGERLPVDGQVRSGTSAVDQSALTGESLPIDKQPGDPVLTGTLNQFGSLVVSTQRIGDQSTLGQVVAQVAEATRRKAPLERTADRLARLFLPAVLLCALLTLLGWRFLGDDGSWESGYLPALAVLVVACPCPLILATPSAVMAAMAWLAREGVVVKGSVALERLASVDTFVFDKTGTLTRGEPVLGLVRPAKNSGLEPDELIRIAASAERASEHLLARLVVREAETRGMVVPTPESSTAMPGFGVAANLKAGTLKDEACHVLVGNRRLLEQHGVRIDQDAETVVRELTDAGQTSILVAIDGDWVGTLGVTDLPRSESATVLEQLKQLGIREIVLLTGDRPEPATALADTLPALDQVHSELLPADKADFINQAVADGRTVAMVGDGINDAPALATASVGIALGQFGSDIAAEAGDLVLMGDPLRPLPGLLQLSRQLVRTIRQSIWLFAFGMNGVGILLGALGLLTPPAAALFHECASLAVMLNALRLLWFQRWDDTRCGRLGRQLARQANRITLILSPSRLTFEALNHWRLGLKLAATIALFLWCTSGITVVPPDQLAVVTRFGSPHQDLEPGWHWRWPRPLETVHSQNVLQIHSMPIGFRYQLHSQSDPAIRLAPVEWNSQHDRLESDATLLGEAQLVTGDELLVELTAMVEYRIGDAENLRRYAFGNAAPQRLLRAAAESAIREVAASALLDDLMADARDELQTRCLNATRQAAKHYQLGLEIVDLKLIDIHPPRQVVDAYRQVADALEERERLINQAQGYYGQRLIAAAGARAISALAQTDKPDDNTANDRRAADVSYWNLDDPDTWKMLLQGNLLSGEAAATIDSAKADAANTVAKALGTADRFGKLLDASSESTRSRDVSKLHLYFQAIKDTLTGRPLTILDPRATGRKHLILTQPGPGNLPPPLLTNPNTTPTEDEKLPDAPTPSTRDNPSRLPR
jgi:Cu+-exporting ATPase